MNQVVNSRKKLKTLEIDSEEDNFSSPPIMSP